MNLQNLSRFILIIVCIFSLFYLGFLYGSRESFNFQPDNVDFVATNGAKKNYLTQIERRLIFGAVNTSDTKTPQTFGELLFIQEESNQTQLLFTFQGVPATVKSSDKTKEKAIPNELDILLAVRNTDGTDFIYENIGKLVFDAPDKSNLRTAKFSTTIDKQLYNAFDPTKSIQRIEFRPTKIEDENIFTLDNADLPIEARKRKAAYFWVNF